MSLERLLVIGILGLVFVVIALRLLDHTCA